MCTDGGRNVNFLSAGVGELLILEFWPDRTHRTAANSFPFSIDCDLSGSMHFCLQLDSDVWSCSTQIGKVPISDFTFQIVLFGMRLAVYRICAKMTLFPGEGDAI